MIITKGLGKRIITMGYGSARMPGFYTEIIRKDSMINRVINLISKIWNS
jgi:hypothetical protein